MQGTLFLVEEGLFTCRKCGRPEELNEEGYCTTCETIIDDTWEETTWFECFSCHQLVEDGHGGICSTCRARGEREAHRCEDCGRMITSSGSCCDDCDSFWRNYDPFPSRASELEEEVEAGLWNVEPFVLPSGL